MSQARIFKNQTTFTSDEIELRRHSDGRYIFDVLIYGNLGTGTVKVLLKNSEGDFIEVPELVFEEATGKAVETLSTSIKVDIAGATDVTVEIL